MDTWNWKADSRHFPKVISGHFQSVILDLCYPVYCRPLLYQSNWSVDQRGYYNNEIICLVDVYPKSDEIVNPKSHWDDILYCKSLFEERTVRSVMWPAKHLSHHHCSWHNGQSGASDSKTIWGLVYMAEMYRAEMYLFGTAVFPFKSYSISSPVSPSCHSTMTICILM